MNITLCWCHEYFILNVGDSIIMKIMENELNINFVQSMRPLHFQMLFCLDSAPWSIYVSQLLSSVLSSTQKEIKGPHKITFAQFFCRDVVLCTLKVVFRVQSKLEHHFERCISMQICCKLKYCLLFCINFLLLLIKCLSLSAFLFWSKDCQNQG